MGRGRSFQEGESGLSSTHHLAACTGKLKEPHGSNQKSLMKRRSSRTEAFCRDEYIQEVALQTQEGKN